MHVSFIVVGDSGGTVHYPANLINAVSKKCDVSVIAVTRGGPEFPELLDVDDITNINIETVGGVRGLFEKGGGLLQLLQELRNQNPDLVHIPFYHGATAFLPTVISLLGYGVVATVHDPKNKEGIGTKYSIRRAQLDSHFMDTILVHGERTEKQAINSGFPSEKLRQIPHGLYPHFRSDPVEHTDEEVLIFGTIRKDKGYHRVPEIAERVLAEEDTQVRVAGALGDDDWGGDLLDQLRNMDGVLVDEGYIPNEAVQSYFERAAVVVLPYIDATTSGVLLTAYTFDTPVVVTDVGDLGWRVRKEETGLVAEPDSVDDIAAKTVKLLDSDIRETKRANILAVKDRYSWEHIADELFDIYHNVLEGNSEKKKIWPNSRIQ